MFKAFVKVSMAFFYHIILPFFRIGHSFKGYEQITLSPVDGAFVPSQKQ